MINKDRITNPYSTSWRDTNLPLRFWCRDFRGCLCIEQIKTVFIKWQFLQVLCSKSRKTVYEGVVRAVLDRGYESRDSSLPQAPRQTDQCEIAYIYAQKYKNK